MVNTLLRTYRLAKERLQKRSWLYLIALIAWHLVQDRIFTWANAKIDEGATGMTAPVVKFILWFNSPERLTVSLVVFIILAIVIHAYWDARKEKSGTVSDTLPTDNQSASEPRFNLQDGKLRLAVSQVENLTAISDEYKGGMEEKEKECQILQAGLSERSEELKRCIESSAKRLIIECGRSSDPLNLSVAVQFVFDNDANLAKKIRSFFGVDYPTPWKVRPVQRANFMENPSTTARIILFSDHGNSGGVESGIRDLLGERVEFRNKLPGMFEDYTIIVFPENS